MSVVPLQHDSTQLNAIDRLVAERRPGYGLARAFYHDPAIYERDLERVFFRHWHCIGHESIIPN
ncbi:MAG: aromatic ring-hydroxylating dioxygenase subunit alpha, partial [Rhizobiales bacterium]|nr:aromatic ring-hydroxylating dioxygenase subunit alpha [Hyphomicrobiales bacterium]